MPLNRYNTVAMNTKQDVLASQHHAKFISETALNRQFSCADSCRSKNLQFCSFTVCWQLAIQFQLWSMACYPVVALIHGLLSSWSTHPTIPGAWQGNHWRTNVEVSGVAGPRIAGINPMSHALYADASCLGHWGACLLETWFLALTAVHAYWNRYLP